MDGAGVDDVADVAAADGIEDLVAAVADLAAHARADAERLEVGSRACGRLDVKAHLIEPAHERQALGLVLIGQRHEHGAVVLHVHAGGLQRLVHGA